MKKKICRTLCHSQDYKCSFTVSYDFIFCSVLLKLARNDITVLKCLPCSSCSIKLQRDNISRITINRLFPYITSFLYRSYCNNFKYKTQSNLSSWLK